MATSSSRKQSSFEFRSKLQRRICEGDPGPSETGSSMRTTSPSETALRKCRVSRAGPSNQRTSPASPSRGNTPTIVGRLASQAHMGSPASRRSRLVVIGTTGSSTCRSVTAMSCMIPA